MVLISLREREKKKSPWQESHLPYSGVDSCSLLQDGKVMTLLILGLHRLPQLPKTSLGGQVGLLLAGPFGLALGLSGPE